MARKVTWAVQQNGDRLLIVDGGDLVAEVSRFRPLGEPGISAWERKHANLMAAAPELLAALQGINERLSSTIQDGDTVRVLRARDIARAAIAKAKGATD